MSILNSLAELFAQAHRDAVELEGKRDAALQSVDANIYQPQIDAAITRREIARKLMSLLTDMPAAALDMLESAFVMSAPEQSPSPALTTATDETPLPPPQTTAAESPISDAPAGGQAEDPAGESLAP